IGRQLRDRPDFPATPVPDRAGRIAGTGAVANGTRGTADGPGHARGLPDRRDICREAGSRHRLETLSRSARTGHPTGPTAASRYSEVRKRLSVTRSGNVVHKFWIRPPRAAADQCARTGVPPYSLGTVSRG